MKKKKSKAWKWRGRGVGVAWRVWTRHNGNGSRHKGSPSELADRLDLLLATNVSFKDMAFLAVTTEPRAAGPNIVILL